MAQRSGIWQITGEKQLYEQLTFYKVNVPTAVEDAIVDAAEQGTLVMVRRVKSAITPWGRFRQSQGRQFAGRIETGQMLDSIYDSWLKEVGDSYKARTSAGGNFQFRFGWVEAPSYTVYQERGTRNIRAMLAVQQGWNVVNKVIFEYMAKRAEEGKNAALARHYYKRSKRGELRGRG